MILGIGAAICHAIAYLDYNTKVIKRHTAPNGSTWAIWSSLAILSASSYLKMTGDVAKSILSLINIFWCVSTFCIALYLKRFVRPDKWDVRALSIGLLAALVWWIYKSAMYANLLLQVAILVGFIPTYRLVWNTPTAERCRPWWIWVGAYGILIATVILRWRGQWQDLAYPTTSIMYHSLVPILSILRLNKKVEGGENGNGKKVQSLTMRRQSSVEESLRSSH